MPESGISGWTTPRSAQAGGGGVAGGRIGRVRGTLVRMGPPDELRAADSDREKIAERLRGALEEGRLDLTEYDDRLGRAYAAKTYGDLHRLVSDLPVPPPAGPQYPAAVRRWLAAQWRPWVNVVSICVAIWVLTAVVSGGLLYFWPFWVAVPWGIVLLVRTVGGLASGEPRQWVARQARNQPPGAAGPAGPPTG